jgi:hypothetical protein
MESRALSELLRILETEKHWVAEVALDSLREALDHECFILIDKEHTCWAFFAICAVGFGAFFYQSNGHAGFWDFIVAVGVAIACIVLPAVALTLRWCRKRVSRTESKISDIALRKHWG